MAIIDVACPACKMTQVVRYGKSPKGKQRYRCQYAQCAKSTFLLDYSYRGYVAGIKQNIVDMALNGSGIRDTARVLNISQNTVMRALKKNSVICSQ